MGICNTPRNYGWSLSRYWLSQLLPQSHQTFWYLLWRSFPFIMRQKMDFKIIGMVFNAFYWRKLLLIQNPAQLPDKRYLSLMNTSLIYGKKTLKMKAMIVKLMKMKMLTMKTHYKITLMKKLKQAFKMKPFCGGQSSW
jgi:hypothetical protein